MAGRLQDKIVAEFQAMVARLNGIFDEKAALLASLGQPHGASPANLVRANPCNRKLALQHLPDRLQLPMQGRLDLDPAKPSTRSIWQSCLESKRKRCRDTMACCTTTTEALHPLNSCSETGKKNSRFACSMMGV